MQHVIRVFYAMEQKKISMNANMIVHNQPKMSVIYLLSLLDVSVRIFSSTKTNSPMRISLLVDGGFSPWSDWSTCTKTCGIGEMTRSRTCTEPAPSVPEPDTVFDDLSVAGHNCTGNYIQMKSCNIQPC